MNCKNIQELIAADYMDSQIEDKQRRLIDRHLDHCPLCQEYLAGIKGITAVFKQAQSIVPDALLWVDIRQAIERQESRPSLQTVAADIWEKLKNLTYVPRPAFALTTILTMIFVIGTTGQLFMSNQVVQINGTPQAEYLNTLINEPLEMGNDSSLDSQTPIEKYFL